MKKFLCISLTVLCFLQAVFAAGASENIVSVNFNDYEYELAWGWSDDYSKIDLILDHFILTQQHQSIFFPAKCSNLYQNEEKLDGEKGVERVVLDFSRREWPINKNIKNLILEEGISQLDVNLSSESVNLNTIVVPGSVDKINLSGSYLNGSRFVDSEGARREKITHGQIDVNNKSIIFLYSEIAKALGITEAQLTFKETYEDGSYCIVIKPEYEEAVSKYTSSFFEKLDLPTCIKAHKNLTIYVKSGSYAENYFKLHGFNVKQYVSVTYNGDEIYSDQPAIIVDGRTLIPLRAAFEALGASVEWDASTRTVISERGGIKIKLSIGSNQLYVNGNAKTLDVPAQIINGRTMVPARAVAEAFGCDVDWNNETRTAIIKE